ncbi:unnamed protein product [Prorocentrum cordatum]|uniref:Methyltransferase FkbM domain-containing protein n=1 Tax=Prorocentrum cordatum TaxID=2364126 RepID=A0ABN9S8V8_9DINO|nr:unnamed protein product [Polarella glacialis]
MGAQRLHQPLSRFTQRQRDACMRRFERQDFAADGFKSDWMGTENLSVYVACLYNLRTRWRSNRKTIQVGGVHYPTLIVSNHLSPPVSASSAQWCWLDNRGEPSGLDAKLCCDTQTYGASGLESCWDGYFTFELCCRGNVELYELPHFFVAPAMDVNVGNAVRQLGTFDLGQSYALQTLCHSGDTVLDIGANVGGFTVPLAERVGPQGKVHAFEPFRKVFQHLNANVALNGLTNVFTHQVALGTERKTLEIHAPDLTIFNFPSAIRVVEQLRPDDAARNANLRYEKELQEIDVRPLDSFQFAGSIRLIKIDVEFMELQVILGGRDTILRHKPVIWVENEPFFDDPPDRTLVNMMSSELGYECRPVAKLELLCVPGDYGEGQGKLPRGFHRVFRHLTGQAQDVNLWGALAEVDGHS